jgi:predicted Na+-dependent transporter
MNDWAVYFGIALGVLVAVLYPVLKGYIQKDFGPTAAPGLPPWVAKYARLFVFCLLSALIVLAVFRAARPDVRITFWVAIVMGFGYEATVEKVFPSLTKL